MLIKTMKLRLDELALYVAVDLGVFLLGSLLLGLITYLGGSEPDYTVFRLGTVMAWVIFCFIAIGMGMFGMSVYFNWHVGFGRTRKSFFICDMATEFCWNLLSLMMIWVLSFAEGGILKLFYGSYQEDYKGLWGIGFGYMVPVLALLLAVMRELTGTLIMRFGNKAFWVMWAIWMIICLVPDKIASRKNGAMAKMIEGITAWITGMSITGWAIMGSAFVILMLAVSWLLMRKQMVKS